MRRAAPRGAPVVPAAAVGWAAAALCVLLPGASPAVAVGLWIGALTALGVGLRAVRARGVLVLAAIALAAGAAVASHVAVLAPGREAAAELAGGARSVDVRAVVASKVASAASGSLWFDADAASVVVGEHPTGAHVPVRVVVAPDDVDERDRLDLGSAVMVRGTTQRADVGERAVLVVFASRGVEVVAPPDGVLGVATDLRRGFVRLAATLPGPGGALLPGLAVGDTSAVDAGLDLAMKTSSLSHLTAVSGANCAIIVGLCFGAAGLCGASRTVRVVVALSGLVGFVVLVTPEPSVVRAAAMAAIAMLGVLLGRATAGLSVLCLAVVVLLVADPWLALSLGFALSAVATGALLVLAPPLARALTRWMPRALALLLAVPAAAQLACGPLLVLVNPVVPLYGVPANLVAGVAAPAATVLGLAACLAAPAVPILAGVIAWLAWLPSAWIAATAETAAALPGASLPWLEGGWGVAALAACGACAVALVLADARSTRAAGAVHTLAVCVVAVAVGAVGGFTALRGPVATLTLPAGWTIAACDVGQGDAVLVRSAGRVALVDTGPEPGPLDGCLTRLGLRRIDILVLTHFDLDHVGGADAVVGRVDVVLHGPPGNPQDVTLLDRLRDGGARVTAARTGMTGMLGEARWRVLWPVDGSRAFAAGNDASVVIDVRGGGVPASAFLGDLSASPQAALLASGRLDPPYAVVKVAHHGSADQHPGLYRALGAAVAVIPVGADNDYGHPRAEILQVLDAQGMSIARTDEDGLVVIAPGDDGALLVWRERAGAG